MFTEFDEVTRDVTTDQGFKARVIAPNATVRGGRFAIVQHLQGTVIADRLVIETHRYYSGARARGFEMNLMGLQGDITPKKLRNIDRKWDEEITSQERGKREKPYAIFCEDNRWEMRRLKDGELMCTFKIVQVITSLDEVKDAMSMLVPEIKLAPEEELSDESKEKEDDDE